MAEGTHPKGPLVNRSRRGTSGTELDGGNEHRAELRGSAMVRRADYMRRGFTRVARLRAAVRSSTTAASFVLQGGDQSTPEGKRIYQACEIATGLGTYRNRGVMRRSIAAALRPFHDHWYTGFRYAEIDEAVDYGPNGRLMWWFTDLLDCDPKAHSHFNSRDNRTLESVQQSPVEFGEWPRPIPAEKLMICVWDMQGSNWFGEPVARPLDWTVQAIEDTQGAMMAQTHRYGTGVVSAHVSKDAEDVPGLKKADIPKQQQELADSLTAIEAGRLGVTLKTNDGIHPKTWFADAADITRYLSLLEALGNDALDPMAANFTAIGEGDNAGGYNFALVTGSLFRRLCGEVNDGICAGFNEGPLRQFVIRNFGFEALRLAPHLGHRGLGNERLAEAMPLVPQLAREGLLFETDLMTEQQKETVRAIRRAIGFDDGVGPAGNMPTDQGRSA